MTEIPGTRPGDDTAAGPDEGQAGRQPRGAGKRILMGVVGVVVALGVYFVIQTVIAEVTGDLSTADVGDCIDNQEDIEDVKVVACDAEDAFMRVIGKNTGWTEKDFDAATLEAVCEGYTVPAGGGAIWNGEKKRDGTGTGDVYCLEPVG
jgi:hypothetical protein